MNTRLLPHLITAGLVLLASWTTAPAQDPASLWVEGYTGQVSYQPGEELTLHLSSTAASVAIEIARLGAQRETLTNFSRIAVKAYPVPDDASANGCGWPAGPLFTIPAIMFQDLSFLDFC